jgi:hypothetical protein
MVTHFVRVVAEIVESTRLFREGEYRSAKKKPFFFVSTGCVVRSRVTSAAKGEPG